MAKFLGFEVRFFERIRVYGRSFFSQEEGPGPHHRPVFKQYQGKDLLQSKF